MFDEMERHDEAKRSGILQWNILTEDYQVSLGCELLAVIALRVLRWVLA